MSADAAILLRDVLFVALTRPAMRWGVTFNGLLVNGVFTMESFLVTKNLLVFAIAPLIHGVMMLVCARDPRYFDLWALWAKFRLLALVRNFFYWRASSYGALVVDAPNAAGCRRHAPLMSTSRVTPIARPSVLQ